MWPIASTNELPILEREKVLVSVYLALDYDHMLTNWIWDSWASLHRDSGEKWHIVIPCHSTVGSPNQYYNAGNDLNTGHTFSAFFSSDFARELAEYYGLTASDLPCLVFDNFIDEEKQHALKLRSFDLKQLMNTFLVAAAYIRTIDQGPYTDSVRARHTYKIISKIKRSNSLRSLISKTPNPTSLAAPAARNLLLPTGQ